MSTTRHTESVEVFVKDQRRRRWSPSEKAALVRRTYEPGMSVSLVSREEGVSATIKNWLARHPRFHVHFTPTSASWLNQVERWFATLTEKYIRRDTHRSTRQLEQAIRHYIKINNDDPKPFVWSKTADEILASVERFCLRTSNSRH